MTTRDRAPFVGRTAEAALLAEVLRSTIETRHGAVILIAGEAGIGKTRLVDEACADARAAGAVVVRGACLDLAGSGLPFGPFVEGLRGAIDRGRRGRRASPSEAATQLGDLIGPLTPGEGEVDPRADPRPPDEFARLRRFEAFATIYRDLAADTACVLVLEDIHWADPSTIGLLVYMVRDRRGPLHQPQDRRGPRLEHPRQARRGQPGRGRFDRPPAAPPRLTLAALRRAEMKTSNPSR